MAGEGPRWGSQACTLVLTQRWEELRQSPRARETVGLHSVQLLVREERSGWLECRKDNARGGGGTWAKKSGALDTCKGPG